MFYTFTEYLKQVFEEFKKIKYPEKKEMISLFTVTIVSMFILGLFCALIDWCSLSAITFVIFGN